MGKTENNRLYHSTWKLFGIIELFQGRKCLVKINDKNKQSKCVSFLKVLIHGTILKENLKGVNHRLRRKIGLKVNIQTLPLTSVERMLDQIPAVLE